MSRENKLNPPHTSSSQTPETALKNQVRILLSQLGWVSFRLNVGTFLSKTDGHPVNVGLPVGFPDLMALKNGQTIFIETKIKPRKPTQQQIKMHKFLRSLGFKVYLIYDISELVKALQATKTA